MFSKPPIRPIDKTLLQLVPDSGILNSESRNSRNFRIPAPEVFVDVRVERDPVYERCASGPARRRRRCASSSLHWHRHGRPAPLQTVARLSPPRRCVQVRAAVCRARGWHCAAARTTCGRGGGLSRASAALSSLRDSLASPRQRMALPSSPRPPLHLEAACGASLVATLPCLATARRLAAPSLAPQRAELSPLQVHHLLRRGQRTLLRQELRQLPAATPLLSHRHWRQEASCPLHLPPSPWQPWDPPHSALERRGPMAWARRLAAPRHSRSGSRGRAPSARPAKSRAVQLAPLST